MKCKSHCTAQARNTNLLTLDEAGMFSPHEVREERTHSPNALKWRTCWSVSGGGWRASGGPSASSHKLLFQPRAVPTACKRLTARLQLPLTALSLWLRMVCLPHTDDARCHRSRCGAPRWWCTCGGLQARLDSRVRSHYLSRPPAIWTVLEHHGHGCS